MADAHKNFAYGVIATPPSPATSGTSLILQTGLGGRFPTPPFNATVWPAAPTQPTSANAEIVRVTALAADTLTITRAQESTSARTIVAGDQIAATMTAKTLTDLETLVEGAWTDVAYNAANFTASGSMTWTVEAADQKRYSYRLQGKTLTISVWLSTTDLGGTASNEARIAIPAGKTAKSFTANAIWLFSGSWMVGAVYVTPNDAYLRVVKPDLGNHALGSFTVAGTIVLEIN